MRARDCEGAQSCGSDRFVVVSAVTSSCELGDLLLHAETAGKQLITDIVNVPLVCAMKVLSLINDGRAARFVSVLSCQHRGLVSVRAFGCICTAGVFSCLPQTHCKDDSLSIVEITPVLLQ